MGALDHVSDTALFVLHYVICQELTEVFVNLQGRGTSIQYELKETGHHSKL